MSTQTRKYELKARAEAQERTRQRIAKAAAELHEEVGPAFTTVAEIARRARVTRLTVYNHFPDNEALYRACSAHYIAEHPLPDLESGLAAEAPHERVRAVLSMVYADWRERRRMMRNLQRDRSVDPVLDEFMSHRSDATLDAVASSLAEGFELTGGRSERLRVMIRVALDFWTWERLDSEGLDDEEAAALMSGAIAALGDRAQARRAA
jgi:AcrR family transcriptional regulator